MNSTIVRIGKGLIVHLLLAAIAIGIIWLMVHTYDDASQSLRDQFVDAADDGESVRSYVADACGKLQKWAGAAISASGLLASLFVSIADGREVSGYEESDSMKSHWWGLWIAMLIIGTGLLWFLVISSDVMLNVKSDSFWVSLAAVALMAQLGFFIATAWGVKLTMKRSVPLSGLIPDSWN